MFYDQVPYDTNRQKLNLVFFPDPGSRITDPNPIFLELSDKFSGKMFYNSLKTGPNFFLQQFKNKIIFNFVKFEATKKDLTTNFFSPLSFVAVFDPESGINIPDPQYCKKLLSLFMIQYGNRVRLWTILDPKQLTQLLDPDQHNASHEQRTTCRPWEGQRCGWPSSCPPPCAGPGRCPGPDSRPGSCRRSSCRPPGPPQSSRQGSSAESLPVREQLF